MFSCRQLSKFSKNLFLWSQINFTIIAIFAASYWQFENIKEELSSDIGDGQTTSSYSADDLELRVSSFNPSCVRWNGQHQPDDLGQELVLNCTLLAE